MIKIQQIATIQDNYKPSAYILGKTLQPRSYSALVGPSGSGKSFIALEWALHIACGIPFDGKPTTAKPVLICCGEGIEDFYLRLIAWAEYHGRDVSDIPLFVLPAPFDIVHPEAPDVFLKAQQHMRETVGDPEATFGLVILDTLSRYHSLDENTAKDAGIFTKAVTRHIMMPLCTSALVVGHTGHAAQGRMRGSSAFHAAYDAEFIVSREGGLSVVRQSKRKAAGRPTTLAYALHEFDLPHPYVDCYGDAEIGRVMLKADHEDSSTSLTATFGSLTARQQLIVAAAFTVDTGATYASGRQLLSALHTDMVAINPECGVAPTTAHVAAITKQFVNNRLIPAGRLVSLKDTLDHLLAWRELDGLALLADPTDPTELDDL